jgi:serpin B
MSVTARMTVVTTEGLRAVDVPLARDDLRLMIVMAEQGEVGELARSLTADRLTRVAATLRQPARQVSLSLPRVAVETRVDLREALTSAGVRDLFSARADLTGIDPAGGLRAAAALHHVRVDLGEAGVGGAGALALGARPAALLLPAPRQQPPAGFAVDRPFLFLVRDRATGAVLFLGRVVDPR